jgi:hypothetical protein
VDDTEWKTLLDNSDITATVQPCRKHPDRTLVAVVAVPRDAVGMCADCVTEHLEKKKHE